MFLNFGEVIEMVLHGYSASGTRGGGGPLAAPVFGSGWLPGSRLFRRCNPPWRRIPFPDDAQPFEREEVVHLLDVFRSSPDHRAQSAGGNHLRVFAQLLKQKLENAIHQPEIPVVKPGLQASDRIRPDHASRLANLDSRQPRGATKQRIGRDADTGRDYSSQVFSFGGHT